jgi:hypothetical protein
MKQTKPAQAMELRSLSPVFGGHTRGVATMTARHGIARVSLYGAIGGMLNACLCYAGLPIPVQERSASFHWHIIPAGLAVLSRQVVHCLAATRAIGDSPPRLPCGRWWLYRWSHRGRAAVRRREDV